MRINRNVIVVFWIVTALSCNGSPVNKNTAGEDSGTINYETHRSIIHSMRNEGPPGLTKTTKSEAVVADAVVANLAEGPVEAKEAYILLNDVQKKKICCACLYQEGEPRGIGECELITKKESCTPTPSSPCIWKAWEYGYPKGKCVPQFLADCSAYYESPFTVAMRPNSCDVTNTFPHSVTWLLNEQDLLSIWAKNAECGTLHVWYAGHGKMLPTDTAFSNKLCNACPEGNNSITCTGCSGMATLPVNDIVEELCKQLKASNGSSITITGNQTYVTTYDKMTEQTITVVLDQSSGTCTHTITYVNCDNARTMCSEGEKGQTYYCTASTNSTQLLLRTCECWWGGWCGYK